MGAWTEAEIAAATLLDEWVRCVRSEDWREVPGRPYDFECVWVGCRGRVFGVFRRYAHAAA
jgi:hypothetical protein